MSTLVTFRADGPAKDMAEQAMANINVEWKSFFDNLPTADQQTYGADQLVKIALDWDPFDFYAAAPAANLFPYVACYMTRREEDLRRYFNLDFCYWHSKGNHPYIGGLLAKVEQIMSRVIRNSECPKAAYINSQILVEAVTFPLVRLTFSTSK